MDGVTLPRPLSCLGVRVAVLIYEPLAIRVLPSAEVQP